MEENESSARKTEILWVFIEKSRIKYIFSDNVASNTFAILNLYSYMKNISKRSKFEES